jgi:hypothetical protein
MGKEFLKMFSEYIVMNKELNDEEMLKLVEGKAD